MIYAESSIRSKNSLRYLMLIRQRESERKKERKKRIQKRMVRSDGYQFEAENMEIGEYMKCLKAESIVLGVGSNSASAPALA